MIESHEEAIAVIRQSVDQMLIDGHSSLPSALSGVVDWIKTQQFVSNGKDIVIRQLNERLGN